MIQKKELQIKTKEDGNFKAEKYKIEIEANVLNTNQVINAFCWSPSYSKFVGVCK